MSKVFKPIAGIGGAVAGGLLGGVPGALIGGALGSSVSGAGDVGGFDGVPNVNFGGPGDPMSFARMGGFQSSFSTPSFVFDGSNLQRRDLSLGKGLIETDASLQRQLGTLEHLRGGLAGQRADFSGQKAGLAELRNSVRPGFGRLTEARVQAIRDAGAENIGNLRESLSRRGVMGSSFANDAISRQRMATGQEEERARAEAAVEELGMTRQVLADEIGLEMQRFGADMGLDQQQRANLAQQSAVVAQRATTLSNMMDRELNELGITGQIRGNLNQQISQQAMQLAQLQALTNQFNAGGSQQAQMANAQNQAGLSQLMLLGSAGLFGQGGALQGRSFF